MRVAAWVMAAVIAAGCGAAPVSAQKIRLRKPKTNPPLKTCFTIAPREQNVRIFMDMPFHGKLVSTCKVRLANGTVVKKKRTYLLWRDSAGRFRIQGPEPGYNSSTKMTQVTVVDPVAHVMWSWDVGKRSSDQALRTRYVPLVEFQLWPGRAQFATYSGPPLPSYKEVSLPAKWVNGAYAVGQLTTQVFKPGANGNRTGHDVTQTEESWLSVDLAVLVRVRAKAADGIEYREDLHVRNRYEPDPDLFAPPADFQIVKTRPVTPADYWHPVVHRETPIRDANKKTATGPFVAQPPIIGQ